MKRARTIVPALAVLALLGGAVHGYISIRVPTGQPAQALAVRWDLGNVAARPNVANRRILYEIGDQGCADSFAFTGPVNEFEAVQNSFAHWRNITESELDFEFTGATTNAVSTANDHRNVIHWVSANISAGVFAVTITTFDTVTAKITDADMELNDRDYTWDTLGPTATQGVIGRAMIENVVTHEAGHFVGIDHTSNSDATMFFQSGPGLINSMSLEADDRAPVIADYPNAAFADPNFGTVQGVVDDGATPRFGVEVMLLDLATGRNVMGAISEGAPGPFPNGSFEIKSVPPGNYAALCWPTNRSALGAYYSTAYVAFYPILRGVAVATAAAPTLVKVGPGATVTGVNISVPAASQTPFEPNGTSATAALIASGQAAVATISPGSDEDWFKFTTTQAGQQVRIRVMADVLGSSLNPTLTLLDTNGSTVLVSPDFGSPVFSTSANDVDSAAFDPSGPNFDAEISRAMGAAGTYFFKVASRVGVTTGNYLVVVELTGADVTADANLSTISTGVSGIAAGGGMFNITVTPRNAFGRDINAPTTFTVDLVDVTAAPVVLATISAASAPFVFVVAAEATSQVRKYSARIGGTPISQNVSVSHYGAVSAANSKVLALEKTLIGNGYDTISVRVDVRDGSNNPFRDPAASVLVSTSLGTLNNGTTSGAAGIAATFDAALGLWRINLAAPTTTGTATVTATVNGTPVGTNASVLILTRASGTGTTPPPPGDDGDSDNGSCAVSRQGTPWLALIALLAIVSTAKRRLEPQQL